MTEEIGPGFYDLLRRVAERHMGPKDGITIVGYDNNEPDEIDVYNLF